MAQTFRLYWLRDSGCDAGTLLRAEELEPAIRERVLALAADADAIDVHLPFIDRREWPRRDEILRNLALERQNGAIVYALPVPASVRDRAAHLALAHPAWTQGPAERTPKYFAAWQGVSIALQTLLRRSIAETWFDDVRKYEDRESAYPMLIYQVARLYHGSSSTELTYDLRDYPEDRRTLELSWKLVGQSLQRTLAQTQQRLYAAGMPALARRYSPVWYEDILVAVKKKPRRYVDLLAHESEFINAVIDLGSGRSVAAVNRFARSANQALRGVYGMDLRALALTALEETTEALSRSRL